jgi:hypothetical protein
MDITTFIAQFLGYFLVLMGGVSLLRRSAVDRGMRNVLKNRGTLLMIGLIDTVAGLLLILAHPSWVTLVDKAVSILSWFLLIEGIFYMTASQQQIKGVLKFLHRESVYYSGALCFVVVGAALVLGA